MVRTSRIVFSSLYTGIIIDSVFIKYKYFKKMIKIFKIVFLLFISLSIFIFSLELFARYKKPSWHVIDPEIGWKLKSNFSHTYKNITTKLENKNIIVIFFINFF